MKKSGKTSFTLHRRFRSLGPYGGSVRWHIEELEADVRPNDRDINAAEADTSYEEEVDREARRKAEAVTREGEDTIAEGMV